MIEDNPELSQQQKDLILDIWNKSAADDPPSLVFLVEIAWGPGTDPRSKKGKLVREFLATRSIKAKLARPPTKEIELTDADKAYIKKNSGIKPFQLARIIFKDDKISNLHAEARAVSKFIASFDDSKEAQDDASLDDYRPPVTLSQTIARINLYIKDELEEAKLTGKQRKDLKSLSGYLHTFRFQNQINTFETTVERQLFESEFIRCTYDKHDLTEEEVDQYIMYSTAVVIAKGILRRISILERNQDEEIEESGKMNMAIVEAVKALRQEYNSSVKSQNDLLNALKVKRSEKLSTAQKDSASILNLVQLWKEKETRDMMLNIAINDKKITEEDLDKISSMDELKARILGISKEEALYG